MNDVKDFFWPFSILWLCVLLGLIACTACKYDSACCYRYIVVCLSVSLCVTNVSPIKTAEPIEIPFGYVLGGPKEPCSWDSDPQGKRAIWCMSLAMRLFV